MSGGAQPPTGRMSGRPPAGPVTDDDRHWLRVRDRLNNRRPELTRMACALYPEVGKLGASRLLVRPEWLPGRPFPLDRVELDWRDVPPEPATGAPDPVAAAPRGRAGGPDRTRSYATMIELLERPRIFDDRPSYRLLSVRPTADAVKLEFTAARYFDAVDVGEACAHELAEATLDSPVSALDAVALPLRSRVGDPTVVAARPALLGVSVLTIRVDGGTGAASFLLHQRDARKVTTGGGQQHVLPVGLFQPPPGRPAVPDADFDLWRLMSREYAEELLGHPEQASPDDPANAFHDALATARAAGRCRPFYLGLGVDPLMLATDALTAVVFDGETFDSLFGRLREVNAEGTLARHGSQVWFPFTADGVRAVAHAPRSQPACAATLILAWQGREILDVG
nr:hypothetical protein [Micromonospora sp. DSM 115978]